MNPGKNVKSPGKSLKCPGRVMELCFPISVQTLSDDGTALLRLHMISYEDSQVELSCHINIDLQAGIYGTEIRNEV